MVTHQELKINEIMRGLFTDFLVIVKYFLLRNEYLHQLPISYQDVLRAHIQLTALDLANGIKSDEILTVCQG